jgi:hypothetical protein
VKDEADTAPVQAGAKDPVEAALVPTVRLAAVTGGSNVPTLDPTEDYHEASRIYPGVVDPFVVGAARLEQSVGCGSAPATRSSVTSAPVTPLPRDLGPRPWRTLDARRSVALRRRPLHLGDWDRSTPPNVTGVLGGTPQASSAPSGGAYPSGVRRPHVEVSTAYTTSIAAARPRLLRPIDLGNSTASRRTALLISPPSSP